MSLWEWLKGFFTSTVQRDVSRLDVPENAIDAVRETVDLSGKPMKEHHLRRTFRDPRLLPKKIPLLRIRKRPPWIPFEEAARLFSQSLLTRNRNIRDLLPDEGQLNRYGLPIFRSEGELAKALEIPVKTLRAFSIHRERETVRNYVTFSIPKRNGKSRLIMAPKKNLKQILRNLNRVLVDILPVCEQAHGFRRGRSVKSNAIGHVKKKFVIKLDIKDFFPSIHFGRVRGYLLAMGYGYPVASVLAILMTEAERQPVQIDDRIYHVPVSPRYCVQGAPTSPGLSNAIFFRADRRLHKLAQKCGFCYSRYADDLTFSGDAPEWVDTICRLVPFILEDEGFRVNPEKTRVMRSGGHQRIAGVTVNQVAGLSRRERKKIRAMIHQGGPGKSENPNRTLQVIKGKIAWVRMLNTGQAAPLQKYLDITLPINFVRNEGLPDKSILK